MSACEKAGLAVTLDQWGNVLATRPGTESGAPGLAFVAHLDHPGFEAVAYDGGYLMCRALGGVPPGALKAGTAVQLLADDDAGGIRRINGSVIAGVPVSEDAHDTPTRDRAVLVDAEEHVSGFALRRRIRPSRLRSRRQHDPHARPRRPGGLRVGPSRPPRRNRVRNARRRTRPVHAGRGGRAGGRAPWPRPMACCPRAPIVVSVESSRTLPGAEIGRGPVIRVGDARTTFDAGAEAYLTMASDRLSAAGEFRCQRQLMSGGVCEATAFSAFGYSDHRQSHSRSPTTTTAVPTTRSLPNRSRLQTSPVVCRCSLRPPGSPGLSRNRDHPRWPVNARRRRPKGSSKTRSSMTKRSRTSGRVWVGSTDWPAIRRTNGSSRG